MAKIMQKMSGNFGVDSVDLKRLGLEMFLTEVNLLLVLYKNGMKHKIKGKEKFLFMAKEYFSKAMQGFKNEQRFKRTGRIVFNEKTIAADTAYHELLVGIKNGKEFQKILAACIDTLQNVIDEKDVDSEKIDTITSILKSIMFEI